MSETETPSPKSELSAAVGNTKGIQPWRRVFHATNGTLVVLALTVLGIPVSAAIVFLGVVLVLLLALDVLRLLDPEVNLMFFRTFAPLASPRESSNIASSTWYALSSLLALLLFPLPYALAGILVLAWADPAANVVGQRWGRTGFMGGTLKGTGAFVSVAFLALVIFVPWPWALVTALVTGLVEALPIRVDDNLFVPLIVGGVLLLLGA
jgi:dolichol kinase